MKTITQTLVARAIALANIIALQAVAPRDNAAWEAARATYRAAVSATRAIEAARLRGTWYPTRAMNRAAALRSQNRAARIEWLRLRSHAARCDQPAPTGYTLNAAPRATWANINGCDTTGYTRHARWAVRAALDTVNRARVDALRAAEMMRGGTGLNRTHAAWERAMMGAESILGYAPTNDGAWLEDTQREMVNARETRAAERGRGSYSRGPSASKVTTRDHYAPHSTLRMLRTAGHAPAPRHATAENRAAIMGAIMAHPTWASYAASRGPVWPADRSEAARATWQYAAPQGPATQPVVMPVHVARDDEATQPAPIGATLNAAEAAAAADYAAMALMGAADPTAYAA